MFDYEGAIHIYRIRKLDMLPLLVTFFLSFYEVAIGIGAGVAVSLIIMLFSHARPKIHITRRGSGKGAVVKSEQNVDYSVWFRGVSVVFRNVFFYRCFRPKIVLSPFTTPPPHHFQT